ncbi:MAG: hypothetical protein HOP30_08015, partial [Cyclobacteriaceae bacterium]|nr:hypothetical protein [Cyclobacteriaceae bacterium]
IDKYLSYEQGGQFGDRFGATTSLFGGLTIVGLLYTIFLQREDLKIARETNRLSIEELQISNSRFAEQNKVLELQRFETTFFNLLNNLYNSRKKGSLQEAQEVHNQFYRSFNNFDCLDIKELQIRFNAKSQNISTHDHYLNYYEQFVRTFYAITDRVVSEIINEHDQDKYFKILSVSMNSRDRLMLWYFLNLRVNGRPIIYATYSQVIFKGLKTFHKSHKALLES